MYLSCFYELVVPKYTYLILSYYILLVYSLVYRHKILILIFKVCLAIETPQSFSDKIMQQLILNPWWQAIKDQGGGENTTNKWAIY